jgi:large subunit ribosomal protein L22
MTGPKTNEGQHTHADEIGTRAHLNTARFSAWKARVVLDLVRGENVRNADQILQLTERGAADVIRKVLASAVANAVNNDNQIADELFISACFADEGPTMKRFRPRARGRGSRILKRTCHITVIVRRLDDATIERMRNAAEASGRGATPAQSRAARVARSRQAAGEETVSEETVSEEIVTDETVSDETAVETETSSTLVDSAAPYGDGSAAPLEDGSAPEGFDIKGNADSMKFHTTESQWYAQTKAEVWFNSTEAATAAGFVDAMAGKGDDEDDAAASTGEEA